MVKNFSWIGVVILLAIAFWIWTGDSREAVFLLFLGAIGLTVLEITDVVLEKLSK